MMNYQNQLEQSKLSSFSNFNVQQQKELHAKILQLYSKIQAKSYENLMIKKQNDQIQVQLNTLRQLTAITQRVPQREKYQYKIQTSQMFDKYQNKDQYKNRQLQISSPRFQDIIKYTENSQEQSSKKLSQKVQFLIKQNQNLEKQMLKIYSKMTQNQKKQKINEQRNQWKNSDGRSTKISNNITSIQQIWGKHQNGIVSKSKFRQKHHRNGSHFMSPRSIKNF